MYWRVITHLLLTFYKTSVPGHPTQFANLKNRPSLAPKERSSSNPLICRSEVLSKNYPTYPWNIPQTPNQRFMKEFLSFGGLGIPGVCAKGMLFFFGFREAVKMTPKQQMPWNIFPTGRGHQSGQKVPKTRVSIYFQAKLHALS